jgi:hypothetical protein
VAAPDRLHPGKQPLYCNNFNRATPVFDAESLQASRTVGEL